MPLGILKVCFKCSPPKAKATVSVPTLPINIDIEIITFPAGLRIGVRPVLNPTVPIALTCSNAKSINVTSPVFSRLASVIVSKNKR